MMLSRTKEDLKFNSAAWYTLPLQTQQHVLALFVIVIAFCNFCNAQIKTEDSTKSETQEVVTLHGPNSITRNLRQDKHGNIWIASWEGVFRYDNKLFSNITHKVSTARFFSVLEDGKGNLWFGSIGSGVYYYDGKSFRNFTTKDGLINNEVTCIYEDKVGYIWLGVNGGVSCYDGKSFRNYMMSGDLMIEERTGKTVQDFTRPPNEVSAIMEDNTGKFWFGTRGHTFIYDASLPDRQGKSFTVLTHNGKPFINVRTIAKDRKGNIWLGGPDGLWRYDGNTFTNFTRKFVGYIIEDTKGNIWTSSESNNGQGWVLSRYDEKSLSDKNPIVTEIASKSMIFGILEDDKGNIWFGADGVYRYDGNTATDFKNKGRQE
jgi:ligand-binding sensor domain-containing protein